MRNFLIFVAIMLAMIMPNVALAQECGELCDPDWWKTASSAEIDVAIKNANIDARDESSRTVLHYAARFGITDNITTLLKAGADGSLKDKDGNTPFDLAKENSKVKGTDAYWLLNDARFK